MDLFKKHMSSSKEKAKEALVSIVKTNISKYIMLQVEVTNILLAGQDLFPTKKHKKNKPCGMCKMDTLLLTMSNCQDIAAEAVKTFKIMFPSEEIDMESIVDESAEKYGLYRKEKNSKISTKGNVILPEDAPEEIHDICEAIQNILKERGRGSDMSVEVINMKGDNYGLKPDQFENFGDFAQAVSKAREENNSKPGEDILNEAIIRNTEKKVNNPDNKEKLN